MTLRGAGGRLALALPIGALVALGLLAAALAVICVASLATGSYPLRLAEVAAALAGAAPDEAATTVVREFRLPRVLVGLVAGALLGVSGAVLQIVTRNPLTDPSLVGVSQGASLAVVTLIVAMPGADAALRPVAAFAAGLAVAAVIQSIAARRTEGATMRFILTGIGVAAFIAALTTALLTYGAMQDALAAIGWLSGSLHAVGWGEAKALTLSALALAPVAAWAARPLAALRLGPEVAIGLGVRVRPARVALITLSTACAAAAVAAVGPIGFVGLVAPHLARLIARAGVGLHLALAAATGVLLVSSADLAGRAAFAPVQIPAGIVTAALGAPIFALLILRPRRR
ncbi:MAG: iron ABC transporter permease [Paracoccaceae bacterium]